MLAHTDIRTERTAAMARGEHVATGFAGMALPATTLRFERNAEIFGEDEATEYLYEVTKGAVRTYRILSDGRRQVCGFYFPGEVFGLEAGQRHTCSAEAVVPSSVTLVRQSALMAAAGRDHKLSRKLWTLTARELVHAQSHALLLIKSARERVADFLLEMGRRLGTSATVELPMSRQDIADYLGLTIETVSRTLTVLKEQDAIALPASRRVVVCNRSALRRLNA